MDDDLEYLEDKFCKQWTPKNEIGPDGHYQASLAAACRAHPAGLGRAVGGGGRV